MASYVHKWFLIGSKTGNCINLIYSNNHRSFPVTKRKYDGSASKTLRTCMKQK
jgi:hypothetical protein